jgi:predicted DCC family thiol-disulfide oxidoreductase YuxK
MRNYVRIFLRKLFGMDIRSLALFRIVLSIFILTDLLVRSIDLKMFYTDYGVLPRSNFKLDSWQFSIHMLNGSPLFIAILFIIAAVFAIFLLLGFHTRISTIISWILLVSLQNRNPQILQGGDVLLRMSLLWAIFMPLGECFAIDSLKKAENRKTNLVFSAATIAYLLQICMLYIQTALLKTGVQWHAEGSAIYYAVSIEQFATPLAPLILMLPNTLFMLLTHIVLDIELFGPFVLFISGIFEPLRIITIVIFLSMHAGIRLFMNVGAFSWMPFVAFLPFLPSLFWEICKKLLTKKGSLPVIYYDGDCGFCAKAAPGIKTLLFLPVNIPVLPAQTNPSLKKEMMQYNSWIFVDTKNNHFHKANAIPALLTNSYLFFPFAFIFSLKPITYIGNIIYEYIAKSRHTICVISEKKTYIWKTILSFCFLQVTPIILISYVIFWISASMPGAKFYVPENMKFIANFLRLDQYWNMFSPFPLIDDGWYIIPANLNGRSFIDLFQHGKPVTWIKPPLISHMYKNDRWRKYMMNMWARSNSWYRPLFLTYLCHMWNQNHGVNEQIKDIYLYYMLKRTPSFTLRNNQPVVQRLLLYRSVCR